VKFSESYCIIPAGGFAAVPAERRLSNQTPRIHSGSAVGRAGSSWCVESALAESHRTRCDPPGTSDDGPASEVCMHHRTRARTAAPATSKVQ